MDFFSFLLICLLVSFMPTITSMLKRSDRLRHSLMREKFDYRTDKELLEEEYDEIMSELVTAPKTVNSFSKKNAVIAEFIYRKLLHQAKNLRTTFENPEDLNAVEAKDLLNSVYAINNEMHNLKLEEIPHKERETIEQRYIDLLKKVSNRLAEIYETKLQSNRVLNAGAYLQGVEVAVREQPKSRLDL